ncbi:MAG: LexA family protein [Flavobacteriales bacterium]
MLKPLTTQQKEVFQFVKQYIEINDYAPTLREIKEATDISNIGLVHKNLSALDKKGYLTKEENTNRGISLTEAGEEIEVNEVPEKVSRNQEQEELFKGITQS